MEKIGKLMGAWLNKPKLYECYLCGRAFTRARVVAANDRWRCRNEDTCQRHIDEMERWSGAR